MNSFKLELSSIWLEKDLGAHEPFRAYNDSPAVRKVVSLVIVSVVLALLQLLVEVLVDHIAKLLFDVSYDLKLSGGCEVITPLLQQRPEVLSDVLSSQHDSLNSVGDGIAFVDWDCV